MKNYPCQVEINKAFVQGILAGINIVEYMGFLSWEDACDWAGKCTMNTKCDFVILQMRDLETNEKERF